MKKTFFIILFTGVFLICCTSTVQAMTSSSNEVVMMSSGVESELSQLSSEELKWFNKFMEGSLMLDGWQDITKKILANTPEEQQPKQRQLLESLGIKIGIEWSKDNVVRRVDTEQLRVWGRKLKKTVEEQPEQLSYVIASIDREADDLLN